MQADDSDGDPDYLPECLAEKRQAESGASPPRKKRVRFSSETGQSSEAEDSLRRPLNLPAEEQEETSTTAPAAPLQEETSTTAPAAPSQEVSQPGAVSFAH